MRSDVMNFYGLKRTFDRVGYFETESQTQLFQELKPLLRSGRLIALAGIVGCGKTTTMNRLQSELSTEKEIIISRSLAVDREKVNLGTLMIALFCDLNTEKDNKLPSQSEQRERKLLTLIQKSRKPVALFVDEAHDLHSRTLVGLKKLIEAAGSRGRYKERDRTLLLLMFRHGLRASEAATLKWDAVMIKTKKLRVNRLKGSRSGVHPLQPDELEALIILKNLYPNSLFVFPAERGDHISVGAIEKMVGRCSC